jgi:hypothetical protein
MLTRFRKDPLIGNVLGLVALFIALGAGAYAAGLAPNSVKSKHIVNGQVKTQDIGEDAIKSTLVPNEELIGADIDEATLGTVPNATNATNADDADDANLLDGKDSSQFQEVGSEGWTNLDLNDAAGDFACHWVSFAGGFADPSYFRDRDGVVHLRGLAKAVDGTGNACGTIPGFDENIVAVGGLPDGYRPQNRSLFTISSNNSPGRIDIFANGTISAFPTYPTYANMEQWVQLDGISYRCAPSGSNGCP